MTGVFAICLSQFTGSLDTGLTKMNIEKEEFLERLEKAGIKFFISDYHFINREESVGNGQVIIPNLYKGKQNYKEVFKDDEENLASLVINYLFADKGKSTFYWNKISDEFKEDYESEKDTLENSQKETKTKKITAGYIYLLKSIDKYKIGRAKDRSRIRTYRTENPHFLEPIMFKKVADYVAEEKYLLELYNKKQFRGEWFNLDETDIVDIIKYISGKEIK